MASVSVIEVHVSGDVFKDFTALEHAHDRYGSRLIYVIARDEETVMKLINEAIQGAYHEIENEAIILRAQELRQLHETLRQENIRRFIRELTRR